MLATVNECVVIIVEIHVKLMKYYYYNDRASVHGANKIPCIIS